MRIDVKLKVTKSDRVFEFAMEMICVVNNCLSDFEVTIPTSPFIYTGKAIATKLL